MFRLTIFIMNLVWKVKIGDGLGWDIDDGLFDLKFSSQITDEGAPCLVLNYEVRPLK